MDKSSLQKPHLFEFRKQNRAPSDRRRGTSGALMTITTFASFDAYDPCAEFGADDMVFWLQPQSTAQVQRSENGPSRYLFLRLTASLSLSAFMTFGSISAAIAPAAAHTASSSDLTIRNEPTVAIEAPTLSLERDLDPERTGGPESEYG